MDDPDVEARETEAARSDVLGLPLVLDREADGDGRDEAGDGPQGYEDEEGVAEALEVGQWEGAAVLEQERTLELHDDEVVAEPGEPEELLVFLACGHNIERQIRLGRQVVDKPLRRWTGASA